MAARVVPAVLAAILCVASPVWAVNGVLTEAEGQRVLSVWGTNYEMGYAHGYLVADDARRMLEVYSFPQDDSEVAEYEWKRAFVADTFAIPDDLREETQGLLDGMLDAGIDPFVPSLGRDFDLDDILLMTASRDLAGLLCTTIMGWESATADDPDLQGAMIIGHNTDYTYRAGTPYFAGAHGLVVSYQPSDPDHMRFIALTYPGFVGVVSGMNEEGVGILTNRGAVTMSLDDMDLDPATDVGIWATREALSRRDFDGDGRQTIDDMLAYYEGVRHFGSLLVQMFEPPDRGDPPAAVLEINNVSRVVRYPADDANLAPDMILALNWEDKLMPERQVLHELRYQQQIRILVDEFDKSLSETRVWDYLQRNRGQYPVSVTFQSMIYMPEAMRVAAFLWTSESDIPADDHVWYDFEDLFKAPPDGDDDTADDDDSMNPPDDDDADDDAGDDSGPSEDDDADEKTPGSDSNSGDEGRCGC